MQHSWLRGLPPPVRWGLRLLRWHWRRRWVARRFGRDALEAAPRLFGNAQTKAGSHLLHQVLLGFTRVGPFVDMGMPPVNRDEANRKLSREAVIRRLRMMRPGDIAYGYLPSEPPFLAWLSGEGWATVFIYRDPRDLVVSHAFYITEMQPGHEWHAYFRRLPDMGTRLRLLITGHQEGPMYLPSIRERCESYIRWITQPGVLAVRFEDLRLRPREAVTRVLDFVRSRGSWPLLLPHEEAVMRVVEAIRPEVSGTFRQGIPGEWREFFTPELKQLFKVGLLTNSTLGLFEKWRASVPSGRSRIEIWGNPDNLEKKRGGKDHASIPPSPPKALQPRPKASQR